MAFTMALLAISGCGKDEKEDPAPTTIKVTGVTLDRQTIGMTEGETASLAATVAPANASDKSVTWSSSAKEVATVDTEGKVTAVKAGEATITVTTKDGGKTASCKVTVAAATVAVTGVEVDPEELYLVEGTSAQVKATVAPENATDKNVTWTSGSTEVATVDENGNVTAVKAGEATITVTTKDGGKTAACKVTVTAKPVPVTGVKLDKAELTLKEGESVTLTATVEPVGATNKKVSWSSNNASVASVDAEGKVTAVSSGEAAIIVTTEDGDHTATCIVTVLKRVTGVTLDKTSITIVKGGTAKLTATVTPYSAADKNVTWKSSDEKIATVDESGNVLGVGFGTTSVAVTTDDGGFTAACEVRVTLASPEIMNAVAGEDNIKVEWNSVSGATSYEVGYKKTDDSGWNVSGTVSGTSHTITGLEAGTSYDIRVRATDGTAFSDYSYKNYLVTAAAGNPDYTYDKVTNTYTVRTAAGLMKWNEEARKNLKTNCVLEADITLSASSGESNWTPVGHYVLPHNSPYSGRFDGQGHTIRNLTIKVSEGSSGIFGSNRGTVMNLNLENASISGSEKNCGGIVGYNLGTIIDCSFNGTVLGSESNVGGIAGINYGTISGCSFNGTVKSETSGSVGGIAGYSYSAEILNSHSSGTVSGDGNIGGIVGCMSSQAGAWSRIVACWSDASVYGDPGTCTGGIAGACLSYSDIISCYFIGKVVGELRVGGIVGGVSNYNQHNYATSCYFSGEITGKSNVGGLVGLHYEDVLMMTSCYWDKYSGSGTGSGESSAIFVDGTSVKWSTATAGMNASIKTWNAASDHGSRQCEFHYVQNGSNLPTLKAGAPE